MNIIIDKNIKVNGFVDCKATNFVEITDLEVEKLNRKNKAEIVIPKGYEIDEILDTDEDDFGDEQPILTEEVKIHFER